jgi:Family of unknown function (DUF5662)
MTEPYDSMLDTLKHSRRVDELLMELVVEIQKRMTVHDQSKMEPPEKAMFDEFSSKLKNSTYNSEEYKQFLRDMPALKHHYENNRHHPEHFEDGINGMNLIDILEMLADWKAAGERHADGDMAESLVQQRTRFGISEQLLRIFENTVSEMGWLNDEPHAPDTSVGQGYQ